MKWLWNKIKEQLTRPELWAAMVLGGVIGELARQAGYSFVGSIVWMIAILALTSVMWYMPAYRAAKEALDNVYNKQNNG